MAARRKGPNRAALDATLREIEREVPDVLVQMLRSLADAVDAEPAKASLWREYREALREVLDAHGDDDAKQLLQELGIAQVGNATDR
jgi:hypothetical protein